MNVLVLFQFPFMIVSVPALDHNFSFMIQREKTGLMCIKYASLQYFTHVIFCVSYTTSSQLLATQVAKLENYICYKELLKSEV